MGIWQCDDIRKKVQLVTACGVGAGIKVEENATVEPTGSDDDGNSASGVKTKPKVVRKTDPFE